MNEYLFNRFSTQVKRARYFSKNQSFLDYLWKPAHDFNKNTPTLVYFLGYEGQIPEATNQYGRWNVLIIRDGNGVDGKGVWYFGTQGEDYLLQSTKQLIKELILCGLINTHFLFFSGKGMGGHAAIYMAAEFEAKGCLAHNPTTNILDSAYVAKKHKSLFKEIFQDKSTHPYRNLQQLINQIKTELTITHDIRQDGLFFAEHIEALKSSSINIKMQSKYDFKEIFSCFSNLIESASPFEIQNYHHENISNKQSAAISIKLSSRDSFSIDQDFSFSLDPYMDRSWRFWFQNFSWIIDHLGELDEKSSKPQADFLICKWFEFIQDNNSDSEFHYHDHSLAYRGMNLIDCLSFVSPVVKQLITDHLRDIGTLLVSPLEDNSLSNHAFDQAIALFLISNFFKNEVFSREWQKISLDRIERELNYSFTFDGVHVENSPSYHHGMITNIHRSLSKVLKITPHQAIAKHLEGLKKSIPYLSWIIRPDGKVPPIGDSEEKQVSTNLAKQISSNESFSSHEGMEVFGEGYAIWKSTSQNYHMTLKSCHHGRFHRHDDDCSVTLWVRGKNLLMDSGLLYYLEKDQDRIHVRSSKGHSGFEIPGKKPNRNPFSITAHRSKVTKLTSNSSVAMLGMYGKIYASRTVSVQKQSITVDDKFSKGCLNAKITLNFIIDGIWDVEASKNQYRFTSSDGSHWTMKTSGFLEDFSLEPTFTSPLKNKKQDAMRLSLTPVEENTELVIDFGGV